MENNLIKTIEKIEKKSNMVTELSLLLVENIENYYHGFKTFNSKKYFFNGVDELSYFQGVLSECKENYLELRGELESRGVNVSGLPKILDLEAQN